MKKMKKMMAVLVVLAMLLSMACTSAYAEETLVEITIDKAESGQTYKLYKLFDLDYTAGSTDTYSYTVESKWETFFSETGAGADFVTITDGYVSWKGDVANKDADLKSLATKVKAAGIGADYTVPEAGSTGFSVKVEPGYYVMESSLGTLFTVGSVYSPTKITLEEKNALPAIDKAADRTTAYIGEEIKYTVTIAAEKGAKGYVVTDDMAGGKLTLITDKVTVTGARGITAGDYTVNTADNKLTVTFEQDYLDKLEDKDSIVITYYAKLNSNAVVSDKVSGDEVGNLNTAVLKTAGVTKSATASVKTYWIDGFKKNESGNPLEGAKFKLYRKNGEAKEYAVLTGNEFSWAGSTDTTFTSDTNGKFEISGLGNGTYYLEETVAPAGYNLLKTDATVTINNAKGSVEVTNKRGQELPNTGGMGTTLFYAFGAVLMAGATVLFVSRKRRTN